MIPTTERSYRALLVWRQSMALARDCYLVTRKFPREELYGLTSQIRRAAASVPANIAEGSGRKTTRDYLHFLRIAQGSLRELETYLLLSAEVGLLSRAVLAPLQDSLDSVAKLLNRLIQALEKKVSTAGKRPSPLTT